MAELPKNRLRKQNFVDDKSLFFRHEKKLESNTPAPNAYNTSGLNPRGTCF